MNAFDAGIAIESVEPGHVRGRTTPEWANMVGPFGGITAATLLHAVQVQPDCHGQPVALTVNFAAPIADGDFDIALRAARTNRSNQHWIIELTQDGETKTTATALFGLRRETWAAQEAAMPPVPAPENVAVPGFPPRVHWTRNYEMLFVEGEVPQPDEPWSLERRERIVVARHDGHAVGRVPPGRLGVQPTVDRHRVLAALVVEDDRLEECIGLGRVHRDRGIGCVGLTGGRAHWPTPPRTTAPTS